MKNRLMGWAATLGMGALLLTGTGLTAAHADDDYGHGGDYHLHRQYAEREAQYADFERRLQHERDRWCERHAFDNPNSYRYQCERRDFDRYVARKEEIERHRLGIDFHRDHDHFDDRNYRDHAGYDDHYNYGG